MASKRTPFAAMPNTKPWVQHTPRCCANVTRPAHFGCLPGTSDEQRSLDNGTSQSTI